MSAVLLALLLAATDPVAPTPVPPSPPPATAAPAPYDPTEFGTGQPDDSAEAIAADSARDLKDSRYYNKPGATRADYDRDWQECRLIARGSRTPGGSPVVVYNPAIISPMAAAGGGIIGGLIANAIAEGEARRANRRSCLIFKGWRLVQVDKQTAAVFATLTPTEREKVFNTELGATDPKGTVTAFNNEFADPSFLKGGRK
ncbi:hypothetical protein [Sandarakinorhabdus sp. DWP1-3-1]|uniref:hypothetical protein n=1 Tax=Sandarakinorhabdus sp. DWP1-3-1 TaxID=2804627 RepID=UPI003CF36069